jgi:L-amino acid N-acyltransferase YncA
MSNIIIRPYREEDLPQMTNIWNEVVLEANAFPQIDPLTEKTAPDFFKSQSFTGVAEADGSLVGLYILHPNNVGRCGHIANASYAVSSQVRGHHIGEQLVRHSLQKGKELGFRILQFNAVVATNYGAIYLYEKLGFHRLGTIPNGFQKPDKSFCDIILYYIPLS